MKRHHFTALGFFIAAPALPGQDAFTFETPEYLYSTADLNGDGLRDVVQIEKTSGLTFCGFQASSGLFSFSLPQPCGMDSVKSLSVGRYVNASLDSFITSSPTAGRLHLLSSASSDAPLIPTAIYPPFPQTDSVAAIDIDGTAPTDIVATGDRGAGFTTRFVYTGFGSTTNPSAPFFSAFYTGSTLQLNPARIKNGQPAWLLSLFGSSPGVSGQWYIEKILPGGIGQSINAAVSPDTGRAATGFFDASGLASFLFYVPGNPSLTHRKITETAGVFALSASQNFILPKAISLVVPQTSAAVRMIAVLHTDGTAATYDFNGSTPPVFRQTITGTAPDSLFPLENGSLLTLTGGTSPTWQRYNFNGSSHIAAANGALPSAAALASSVSNVIFFNGEPLVSPAAAPLAQFGWREWTTSSSPGTGLTIVSGSVLASSTGGLGGDVTTGFPTPSGTSFVLVNQLRSDTSIFSLTSRTGPESGDVTFSPPPGTYPETPPAAISGSTTATDPRGFTVRLSPTASGDVVYYRTGNSTPWIFLSSTGLVELPSRTGATLTTTIEAYSQPSNGSRRSPIRSATYIRPADTALLPGTAPTDADNDGLPDAWEKNSALSSPTADDDGDGFSNYAEFAAGTDPRSASSIPPSTPSLVLTGQSTVGNGGAPVLRLEWSASDPTVILETAEALPGLWSVITNGIISTTGGIKRYDVNYSPPAAPKNFYRLRRP